MQDPLLTLDDLLDHLETQVCDLPTLSNHFKAGTLNAFYDKLKHDIVADLLLIPVRRAERNLSIDDDADTLQLGIEKISVLLSTLVGKMPSDVQQDIMTCVRQFPFQDLQQSTYLKRTNMLN